MQVDDTRPIWVQLVEEFRRRIVTGQWAPESRVPSVRELAQEAGVNPNTVQRALAELDRAGLTATERTSGRFVTADAGVVEAIRRELAMGAARAYRDDASAVGLDLDRAVDLLTECWPGASGADAGDHDDNQDDSDEH
ncbi:GntR family transcriptional regulator [Propionibacterium australiense]|uniref:GntR family transcriptional regulator n=1 Tax=Propionibacterium australiense TaxID=119981 RepID=A0A383S5E7_9ACTN|nr:GntR family transcriptional regulator [Propionibacterium australiense]RLP10584.1 GntR family transcriptional regulator [Propionibacterium australiense]RLP12880.1 GntR family transcriptional regulator [Propionibacterium australiense]SYZ32782.1 Transcription regulator HTH, GntR [Propionibacterium australiense]VEH91264.1 HTH-type transcriptional repressor yvoA [Propionibacterium australiense]